LSIFKKICWENSSFIKIGQKQQVLYVKIKHILFITSYSVLLRMRNISDKNCRENQNTHFMFNTFFLNIMPFMR